MTPLRQRSIEDRQLRKLAPNHCACLPTAARERNLRCHRRSGALLRGRLRGLGVRLAARKITDPQAFTQETRHTSDG
jgi:hypothetical protein